VAGHVGAGNDFGYFVENIGLLWGRFALHFRVVAEEKLFLDSVQIRGKVELRLRDGGRQGEIGKLGI
jgi:hypothetical protein